MADTAKLVMVQSFTYRGAYEEWSNTYHWETDPATTWGDAADALLQLLLPCFDGRTKFERAYGYDVGPEVTGRRASSVVDLDSEAGSAILTGGPYSQVPGDVAATVRWGTAGFTAGGKRIYLRKYFHGVYGNPDPNADQLLNAQKTLLTTFAGTLTGGNPIGCGNYVGPSGAIPIGQKVNDWLTTRTLKRRGKRPPTTP